MNSNDMSGRPGASAFVEVTALHKSFDGTMALQGVSFDVALGTTVSLLGPSGCGKTTMLRSIAGLEMPSAGRIRIGDTVVFDSEGRVNLAPETRQVGMVFQSYAVWPHMTVAENVGFPLKIRRVAAAEIESRVADVLALVGLAGLGGRPATNLSGGQQQRVALARAIIHEPRLVLFDEPLSNLDAKLRDQMRTELKLLQNRLGFTAIYVTHDQAEALALSDNVVVMNHGLIEGMASPRELFAYPTTPFVANFLGFDNMFEGKVAWVGAAGNGSPNPASGDAAALPIGVTVGKDVTLRCFWRGGEAPSSGEPVILAFRSERVTLGLPAAQDDPGTNRYDGSVAACVYVGTYQDYLIQAGPIRVRAVGPGDSTFGQGERVTVSIRPDDCRVFSRKKFPGWRGSGE
ncbi:MAG: ABC transporter ATP-binding protein [Sulfuricaulis sp.]|nr:ABC transporter ATP-binding protein [Sulfuricaulis sp.]